MNNPLRFLLGRPLVQYVTYDLHGPTPATWWFRQKCRLQTFWRKMKGIL